MIRVEYLYDDPILLRSYTRQMLEGLNYIHETIKVIYGDLKPKNMLIKGDQIKIFDFGYAVNLNHRSNESDSEISTENTPYEGMGKSRKSDMYSFGVILFEMCHPPFESTKKALNEFRENIDDPIIPTKIYDDFKDLYSKVRLCMRT